MWVVCLMGTWLLGHVGAFHTAESAAWVRYPYFLILNLAGGLFGALALEHIEVDGRLESRSLVRAGVLVLSVAGLLTPLVWVLAGLVLNGSWHPARMFTLFFQVVPVAIVFVTLQWALVPARNVEIASAAAPPEPRSTDAGRISTQGLQAIEAEDHYLRLHTADGSTLVMMRLADAIDELQNVEGAQTHRSWWVCRRAVVGVSRGRGRASLQLANGLTAPVSRTFAPTLRKAGWF